MKTDIWHQRWHNQEIGFHQAEINPYLRRHWALLDFPTDSRVFVPLCGKSLDLLWLRERGHEVLGIEVSPLAVQAFFEENDLHPQHFVDGNFDGYQIDGLTILCGDFFDLYPERLGSVSGVYDRASLVALPADMRERYATHLISILPADTEILLVSMEYPAEQMEGPPFPVPETEILALYQDQYRIERLETLDMLEANPRFRDRGLTRLAETIYHLQPGNNA